MSSKHRRTIAKEIVDQTLSHFKKQREDAAAKQPHAEEVERKPNAKYEPSAHFAKTFSEIMGERPKPSNSPKLSDNPRIRSLSLKTVEQSGQEEKVDAKQECPEKLDAPQAPQQAVEPEHKEEPVGVSKPAQPSIFERLSRREGSENTPPEPEKKLNQSNVKEEEKKDAPASSARTSVFERLARSANTN